LRSGNTYGVDSTCREVRVLSALVGTEEREEEMAAPYRVFPNPASSDLTIVGSKITENCTAALYNTLGQSVGEIAILNLENHMSLQSLSTGLYWLCIRREGRVIYQQAVVRN